MSEIVLHSEMLARMEEAGALSAIGLDLTKRPDLSYDRYVAIGRLLGRATAALRWAVGDFLIFGEDHFGELAAQASEELGISPEGRMELARVARAIPRHRRRAGLTWAHHRAVASHFIEPHQREELFDRAERDGLTSRDLEVEAKKLRAKFLGHGGNEATVDCEQAIADAVDALRKPVADCYGAVPFEVVVRPAPGIEILHRPDEAA
jgi:hypothetical protein